MSGGFLLGLCTGMLEVRSVVWGPLVFKLCLALHWIDGPFPHLSTHLLILSSAHYHSASPKLWATGQMVIHIKECEALPLGILLPFPPKSYRPHDLKEGPCDYIASWEQMRSCFRGCPGPPGLSLDREQSRELIVVKNEHSVHMPYSWVQSAALSHPLDSENGLCAGPSMG